MKKNIKWLGLPILLIAVLAITVSFQQDKNKKGNKEQHQKQGKGREKQGKEINDEGKRHGDDSRKMDHKNDGDNKEKNNDNRKDNDNNHAGKNKYDESADYHWDRETFKDRKKIKNQDKVTVCHKFNRDAESPVTIRVSANAVKAHMNHGDVMGDCPAINNDRYSNTYLRNRTDYYNTLQNSQEQVYYSRSILGYAIERLATSRLQLATMRNNNLPVAEIERKQATVVELEQNVSVLETLLNVAATLVASKLQ